MIMPPPLQHERMRLLLWLRAGRKGQSAQFFMESTFESEEVVFLPSLEALLLPSAKQKQNADAVFLFCASKHLIHREQK